ncbi:MAG: 16S rRNA (cytosine(1402)-N(4))-methyltransferase RsmH [Pirellulales bacterium]
MPQHRSVLPDEVVHWLRPQGSMVLVDGTLGAGGHTRALAERLGPGGLVIALDRDPAALKSAEKELAGLPVKLVWSNFSELPEVLAQLGIPSVDGAVLDLGLSSDQLADRERGFSFDLDGPLDMRFDPTEGQPAWQLLKRLDAEALANLIYRYGEERYSRRIARRIIDERRRQPIRTSAELARLVRLAVPKPRGRQRIDPATRTFQALRIAVNDELTALEQALARLPDCLRPGGRLAIISFHSLEDRLVKQAFRDDPRYHLLTRRPIRPSEQEIASNPRSRSAKLRVAEKVEGPASGP